MKLAANPPKIFSVLASLDEQLATALELLTELPTGSSGRRHIVEWSAETLSAKMRIEKEMALQIVPKKAAEHRRRRCGHPESAAPRSIAQQRSR